MYNGRKTDYYDYLPVCAAVRRRSAVRAVRARRTYTKKKNPYSTQTDSRVPNTTSLRFAVTHVTRVTTMLTTVTLYTILYTINDNNIMCTYKICYNNNIVYIYGLYHVGSHMRRELCHGVGDGRRRRRWRRRPSRRGGGGLNALVADDGPGTGARLGETRRFACVCVRAQVRGRACVRACAYDRLSGRGRRGAGGSRKGPLKNTLMKLY